MIPTGRYTGSLTQFHGMVLDLTDCICDLCAPLSPWDDRRRYRLIVQPETEAFTVRLAHVRADSFDAYRR